MGLRSSLLNFKVLQILPLNSFTNNATTKWNLQQSRLINFVLCSFRNFHEQRCPSSSRTSLGNLGSTFSQPCSQMAATEIIERETELPVLSFCQHKFKTIKNGGNGMSKAFSSVVSLSAACLIKGGVIAVPTDTIYGVACLAQNIEAVGRIYEIKNRNFQNPVAISVGSIDDIYRWSKVTVSREVLADLLPGPVTVVFERSPELNPALNPQTNLVGIRIPNHLFIQNLAKHCDTPIALTSANISGTSSCLQVEEFENLWPKLDLVVNGGKLSVTEESRSGSTVVDLSMTGTFRIIRTGSAHKSTLACLQEKHKLREILPASGDT